MAILFIDSSKSTCGNCGHSASWAEKAHITRLGLGNDRNGCGAEFTELSSHYFGMDDAVKACRPDLPFIDPMKALGEIHGQD